MAAPSELESHDFNTGLNQTKTSNAHPEYIAFVLVPVFFLTGLLGILICRILANKGYRCTTDTESECEEKEVAEAEMDFHDSGECNVDTVGQMVQYIMKNPANAEALHAMLDQNAESPASPNGPPSPVTPESPVSPTGSLTNHYSHGHHLHTVGGIAGKSTCSRCSHRKSKRSKDFRRSRAGEVTVFAVGRFRVTHVDPKSHSNDQKVLLSAPPDGASTKADTYANSSNQEVPNAPGKLDVGEETLQEPKDMQ